MTTATTAAAAGADVTTVTGRGRREMSVVEAHTSRPHAIHI